MRDISAWIIRPDGTGKNYDKKSIIDVIADSDDVEKAVVKWIPTMPKEISHPALRPIPIRRNRIVNVAEPKKRIELLAGRRL